MKKTMKLVVVMSSLLFLSKAFAGSIAGNWTTIDDVTGKQRAVIHVSESGDTVSGTIMNIFPQPGDTGICSKCPGAFKGKPIKGLTILWGVKKSGENVWDNGRILDPKNGKIYRVKLTLEGNTLHVRAYIGVSLLGRTQVWKR